MPPHWHWQLSASIIYVLLAPTVSSTETLGSVTDYVPQTNVKCPNVSFVRQFTAENQTLHPQETDYIATRASTVLPDAWNTWLSSNNSQHGYNTSDFQGHFPKVGIAISGGGLRAALYGAGALRALDVRFDAARAAGTGGFLQVASYLTGLSGGSWLTGSLYFNNWPMITEMVLGAENNGDGWMLDLDLITPGGNNTSSDRNQQFFGSILWSMMAKAQKGIDTSMTDSWSRMISFHFLNQTTQENFFTTDSAHGAGLLWSNIPSILAYQQHQAPFPILVANSGPVDSNMVGAPSLNSTVYEITPMELASYDPSLSAGMNLTYAGTQLTDGEPASGSACITGFDQAGFIMGTSGSFSSQFDFYEKSYSYSGPSRALVWALMHEVGMRRGGTVNWPNPFTGLRNATFQDANSKWLNLIDGASNSANVPYDPLFVKARALDVIVTIEGSADHPQQNWPNGSSLLTTLTRLSTILSSSHQQFPPIPSTPDSFIVTGVNARATFFGCDPQQTPPEYPFVIYLPNAPPINGDDPVTNTPTFKTSYTSYHQGLFLDQVYNNTVLGFTPYATIPDHNFGTCLQCAAIDRARFKVSPRIPRSDPCAQCFRRYCYDPKNPPSKQELPGRHLYFVDPVQDITVGTFMFSDPGVHTYFIIACTVGGAVLLADVVAGMLWWKKQKNTKRRPYQRGSRPTLDDDTRSVSTDESSS